jgi:phosphoribosylformimino-5-aminoimidazole carboxamide ribotide isomerase
MFRIVFVLDIYNGTVMHARGGDRRNYRPVNLSSEVCETADPAGVVQSLAPQEVYIADLNLLQGEPLPDANMQAVREISRSVPVMLDAGIRELSDAGIWADLPCSLVLGTETSSLETISAISEAYPGRVSVSIDIKGGRVLSASDTPTEPLEVADILGSLKLRDIICLDLDGVGTGRGADTELLRNMNSRFPQGILAGGGVKDMADLRLLAGAGLAGALVATAVHNGNIPLDIIRNGVII